MVWRHESLSANMVYQELIKVFGKGNFFAINSPSAFYLGILVVFYVMGGFFNGDCMRICNLRACTLLLLCRYLPSCLRWPGLGEVGFISLSWFGPVSFPDVF